MSENGLQKILTIILYLFIILMIPIFLDFLARFTIRNRKRMEIKFLAEKIAKKKGKPLVIFNDPISGVIIHGNGKIEAFDGDIINILEHMNSNTLVIILSDTMEYVSDPMRLYSEAKRVSGNDLYICGYEKYSVRYYIDPKIINIMDKSYYFPTDETIDWRSPNVIEKNTQKIYAVIFKVLPYNLLMKSPFEKAN